jgi:putative ABC transport system permease protein
VIGQMVEFPVRGREKKAYEVIGVVADARYSKLVGDIEAVAYEPAGLDSSFTARGFTVVLRANTSRSLAADVRAIASSLDPALPIGPMTTIAGLVDRKIADSRVLGQLMSGLAVVATLLAAVGLYAVVAFGVAQRVREFGVRVALGAGSGAIVALVMRRMSGVVVAGLLIGLGGAVGLVRALESRLIGVDPFEPSLWAGAAAGLLAIVLLAAIVPAFRATRVDVTQTLKVQ